MSRIPAQFARPRADRRASLSASDAESALYAIALSFIAGVAFALSIVLFI
jgi:hypothetical protein